MSTSVFRETATITAGTAKASPLVVNIPVVSGIVDAIRWRVPPGPRGLFGWQLAMGGVTIIPENAGAYIVADDEYDEIQVSGLPDSGAWQVIGYNTGTFDHTVYLDFHITPIAAAQPQGGDILAGFPSSDADIATLWLT